MAEIRLRLLGTATSQGVPVIGCDCSACKSSDPRDQRLRNSAMFSLGEQHVIIDTGPDFRQQMLQAKIKEIAGVLYSHEHNDHVAGLDDVRPFCFRQNCAIKMYALPRVAADIQQRYAYAFSDNPYPGAPVLDLQTLEAFDTISLGGMRLQAIPVEHGDLPILGYRCGDKAYLTDVKSLSEAAKAALANLEVLVITCLQYGDHHAHMNLEEALTLAEEMGAKRTVFTHLSHRIGLHSDLEVKLPPGVELGYDGMRL